MGTVGSHRKRLGPATFSGKVPSAAGDLTSWGQLAVLVSSILRGILCELSKKSHSVSQAKGKYLPLEFPKQSNI